MKRGDRGLEIDCVEVVELVTLYLEGALDADTGRRVREHLDICAPCQHYVAQMRITIERLGYVPVESLSTRARTELVAAFRTWRDDRHG